LSGNRLYFFKYVAIPGHARTHEKTAIDEITDQTHLLSHTVYTTSKQWNNFEPGKRALSSELELHLTEVRACVSYEPANNVRGALIPAEQTFEVCLHLPHPLMVHSDLFHDLRPIHLRLQNILLHPLTNPDSGP
jgi:hypothetical protein